MRCAERPQGAARFAGAAACAAAVLLASVVRASDTPDTDFVEVDAAVYSGVIGNGVLHLGGAFTTVNGLLFPRLAAVNLGQAAPVSLWAPQVDDVVRAQVISPNGRTLYLGGDFTEIGTTVDGVHTRNRLAALNIFTLNSVSDSALLGWNPGANGVVRALALSADGSVLYLGGDFTEVGGAARNHIAGVSTASGAVLPWNPGADGVVRTFALSADGATLYAGGDFGVIGGQARRGLAAVSTVNGSATNWNPSLTGSAVHRLLRSGTTLYVGGAFSQIGGQARNNLAALLTTLDSGMATGWNPDVDGEVRALALSGDGTRLYAGGTFSAVNGAVARSRLAGFRTDVDGATALAWDPGLDSTITAIDFMRTSADGDDLYVGGDFTRIGATDLAGLAAFGIAAPQTAPDIPAGGYQSLAQVTLTCTVRPDAVCAEIYYTADGSDPVTPVSYTGPVSIAIAGDTTLRYYSVDADGNRESVRTAVYAVDTSAPATVNSLAAGLYGSATVQDVVLGCTDDHLALGCTTYYTLDGTAPTTASTVYTEAISLAGLFPPADIDPEEVDPLLHLAGDVTLRYFSVDDAGNAESARTVVYQIDLSGPRVDVSHPAGNYAGAIAVTLACNDGTGSGCADMYYTLDDTTPSDGTVTDDTGNVIPQTAHYTGPITIASASVLRVLALDNAGNQTNGIIGIYSFTTDAGDDSNSVGGLDFSLLLLLALGWWRRIIGDGFNIRPLRSR